MRSPAFVASIIASLSELQLAYPSIKDFLADGKSWLPMVKAFHTAVSELTAIDKYLTVKSLLKCQGYSLAENQALSNRDKKKPRMT